VIPASRERPLAEICVSANCSLSVRGAWIFFGLVTASSLTVALFFAWHGFWPVLPFAGLELFGLGVALGYSMRQGGRREVISVFPDEVVVERLSGDEREVARIHRHWAHARLLAPRGRDRRSRLVLRAHGKEWEVGAMLNEASRVALGRRLEALIGGVGSAPDTGPAGPTEFHQNTVSLD
jgi:uncharacterized membrane protein